MRSARIASLLGVASVVGLAACSPHPEIVGQVELVPNPSGRAPLSALLRFTTREPARVTLAIDDGEEVTVATPSQELAMEHEVPVLGVRPGRSNHIGIKLEDADGKTSEAGVTFTTPPLPDDVPPIEVRVSVPSRMEPGVTLVPFFRWDEDSPEPERSYGLILGLDAKGEIVWMYRTDHMIDEPRPLRNGHLLYQGTGDGRMGQMYEIDMLGNVVRQWHTTAIPKDVPAESIPVETGDTFHHDVFEMASGHLLTLSTEVRRMDWPEGPGPGAAVHEASVVGDVLLEIDPASGEVVRSWKLFDLLDPQRRGYESYTTDFYAEAYKDLLDTPPYDWTHMNAVYYLESQDAAILSSPAMSALFKLDLASSKLDWIVGMPDGWREPWSDLLLAPRGDLHWFGGQHAVERTPQGSLLLFDNYRPTWPPTPPPTDDENYSRVLELKIDEESRTVGKVWSWGGPGEDRFLAFFISEADSLPRTGNVLVTAGGQMRDASGKPTTSFAGAHHWVTLTEVTHTEPAEKVWEIVIDDPRGGWASYRSERISGLYPASR